MCYDASHLLTYVHIRRDLLVSCRMVGKRVQCLTKAPITLFCPTGYLKCLGFLVHLSWYYQVHSINHLLVSGDNRLRLDIGLLPHRRSTMRISYAPENYRFSIAFIRKKGNQKRNPVKICRKEELSV